MIPNLDETKIRKSLAVADNQLPPIARFRRKPPDESIKDIPEEVNHQLKPLHLSTKLNRGDKVAITAGSRGIKNIQTILSSAVNYLQNIDLRPFVFPAMGSHGGATVEGQLEILRSLGITKNSVGCPVRASMETTQIGRTESGFPVYVGQEALKAEGVLVVNRIKPHTSFTEEIESGLIKMMAIGMGKQRGARFAHKQGFTNGLGSIIEEAGRKILADLPIVGGLAVVEDFHDQTANIEGLSPDHFFEKEKTLLKQARKLMPTLPIKKLDILIVNEIGKNISGTGMDTNVIGRMAILGEEEPKEPRIDRIYARDLTEQSHGNAIGVGLVDFAHRKLVDKIKFEDTYLNCLTGTGPEKGKIPLTFSEDKTALKALFASVGPPPKDTKLLWIKNTSELTEFYATPNGLEGAGSGEENKVKQISNWAPFQFNKKGNFLDGKYFD